MSHQPYFLIFSLSRSGSTALYRALELAGGGAISYEPFYEDYWKSRQRLHDFYDRIRKTHLGVKRVWDPNGSPFENLAHRSTLEALRGADRWCEVNKLVLQYPWTRIIFLRRQDQLARTLSDLIGQQTDLWGHEPRKPHSEDELQFYRRKMGARALQPVDLDLLEWYIVNVPRLERELLGSISHENLRVVEFDDLFGSDVPVEMRLQELESIVKWLGIENRAGRAALQPILKPQSKYNDETILNRIPNIADVMGRFGRGPG